MKSIPPLLILADDVTGAADCAARCTGAGLPATIMLTQPTATTLPTGAVAISSDSRYLAPATAAARVQTWCGRLQGALSTPAIWYKKIDSTLRGNIGAELAAMLALTTPATQPPCAVISPGFPAHGRGLVGGYLAYAQAPHPPLHLPTLLQAQTTLPQTAVELAVVRAGITPSAAALIDGYRTGTQLFVVDGVTEADLSTIYQATQQALPHALFCGSAGLMGVIATALVAAQGETVGTSIGSRPPLAYPILAVIGSGSVMAHRQLQQLRQASTVDIYEVDLAHQEQVSVVAGLGGQAACALHLPPPPPDAPLEGALARQYAATLCAVAQQVIQQRQPRTLLLVGGDTAVHLLQLLGIEKLQVEAELLPGMPLTTGTAADGQRYQIILKAGNHGDEQTLLTLFAYGATG